MTDGISEQVIARKGAGQLKSIQVARGFAALAVVAFHATATQGKYFGGTNILPGFFDGGQAGVDLFFAISGFVMVLTTRGRHTKPREVGKFLWNRFFRIYPTYWVYFLLLIPVFLLMPAFINASQGGHVDLFSSFFLLPSETLPLLLVAWTLTIELWFYIVFAIILFLPERVLPIALAVWLIVLVILNRSGPISANPYLEVPANAMAIEFILGGTAALLFRHVNRIVSGVLAVAGIVLIITLGSATDQDLTAGPGLMRPLTLGVGFALLLLAATAFENRGGIGIVGRLSILGDMSYSIYLGHVLVLAVMGRVWQAVAGPLTTNVFAVGLWWILTLAAVLGFAYLSYRLVERPVMKLSRRWRASAFHEKPRVVVATSAGSDS